MSPSALRTLSLKGLLIFAAGVGTIATAAHLLIPRKSPGGRQSLRISPEPTLLEKEINPQRGPDTPAPEQPDALPAPITASKVPDEMEPKEETKELQSTEGSDIDYDALSNALLEEIILAALEKFQNSCPYDKNNLEGLRHFFSNVQRLNDALTKMKEEQQSSKKP